MLHIVFRYKDAYSHGEWRKQECTTTSVNKCIEFYGLNEPGCQYEILEVTEISSKKKLDK
jgi:hypothetical protein